MGTLEEALELIADRLGEIVKAQKRMVEIADWNRRRLSDWLEARPEQPAEAAADEGSSWTYESLKTELLRRGVEVPKGTKMATLMKKWETAKDLPVKPLEEPVAETAPAEIAKESDAGETKPAEEAVPSMTKEEARAALIARGYAGAPNQVAALKSALAFVGKDSFADLNGEEFTLLLREYDRLMGEARNA